MININQAFNLITRFRINIDVGDQLGIAAAFIIKEESSMIVGNKSV